ncbi:MAG: DUF2817 domain-containing protein [Pseudomonadales bacterium]|nr:DUF2817 domain-containing protein [Pseudomonadales bacterium]
MQSVLTRIGDAEHITCPHPESGPDGDIAMDVACWNAPQSEDVLVISSGTHGIEGYCGSFVQCALLDEGLPGTCVSGRTRRLVRGNLSFDHPCTARIEPQWSNQRIQEVVQKHLLGRNVVWVDDFRRASSQ